MTVHTYKDVQFVVIGKHGYNTKGRKSISDAKEVAFKSLCYSKMVAKCKREGMQYGNSDRAKCIFLHLNFENVGPYHLRFEVLSFNSL